MAFNYFALLSYLLVASASASFGFLLGTLLQSGKVSKLYRRLEVAKGLSREQAARLLELTTARPAVVAKALDPGPGAGPSAFPQFAPSAPENVKTVRKRAASISRNKLRESR